MAESGGSGGQFTNGRADTALVERAIRERWNIPQHLRSALPVVLSRIIADPDTSNRDKIAASRAILTADNLNMEQEKRDSGGEVVNVVVGAMTEEEREVAAMTPLDDLQDLSAEDMSAALRGGMTPEEQALADEAAAEMERLDSTAIPLNLNADQRIEWLRCRNSPSYFINKYAFIFDKVEQRWLPFRLWDCQRDGLDRLTPGGWLIVLKTRQIGWTWLVLAFLLWLCLFRPAQQAYLFSIGLTEAKDLTWFRLRGMVQRLPPWMAVAIGGVRAQTQEVNFGNGSRVISLPGGSGRSYAATFVLIDEADFNPDLDGLRAATEPAVEGAGWMILLSTADKAKPTSRFKMIYRAAEEAGAKYRPVFYGYDSHPGRDDAWYRQKEAEIVGETGSRDMLTQEYPRTVDEAMAPLEMFARLPSSWVEQCYQPAPPLVGTPGLPAIPNLTVWKEPERGRRYALGVDPSEGQPGSHESPIIVVECHSCEQVAMFPGPAPMHILGSYIAQLALWYNRAGVLVERNNHGHAVLLWLDLQAPGTHVMCGPDGRAGWLEGNAQKMLLYDLGAKKLREQECVIHDAQTRAQLCTIEAMTLKAPIGLPDDRAMTFVIALTAADCSPPIGIPEAVKPVGKPGLYDRGHDRARDRLFKR